MPLPFKGTINGTATSEVYNLPFIISYFTIVNKNAGATTINLSVTDGSNDVLLLGQDLNLSEGDFGEGNFEQIMDSGSQIKLVTSAEVDYYFKLENVEP